MEAVAIEAPDTSGSNAAIPPGWSGAVTAVGAVHSAVPHGGAELPVVSPDGRWIAYFDHADETVRPTSDSLISGRGLEGVSLWVRRLDEAGGARPAALEGACWPSWAGDASALFFVTYDASGRCYLGRFDVASGAVQRKAVGLRHMLQAAANHDGSAVAVVGYANVPDQSAVFVVDWAAAAVEPVPAVGVGAQVCPAWASGRDLLFVALADADGEGETGTASLCRWRAGAPTNGPPRVVSTLELPTRMAEAVAMQQGLPTMFSPDRGAWMARDAYGVTRIVELASAGAVPLPGDAAAAAWWDPPWVVVGTANKLELIDTDPSVYLSADIDRAAPLPVRLRLLSGRWAPRLADPQRGTMVLVGQGEDPDRLAVYQLWVVVADE